MRTRTSALGAFLIIAVLSLAVGAQSEPFDRALERGTVEQKRDALFAIRNLRSESASRLAVPALRDPSVIVRATAAASVVFLLPPEAVSVLVPLLRDRDSFVRREAAYALGEVGSSAAAGPLIDVLDREKVLEVRSAAALALGVIGDVSAIAPLLKILAKRPSENDEFIRRSSARSIGQIAQFTRTGVRDAVTPRNFLPPRFKTPAGPFLPWPAGHVGVYAAAVAAMTAILNDRRESNDTRREAAFALGSLGDPSALRALRAKIAAGDYYLAEISREAVARIEAANR